MPPSDKRLTDDEIKLLRQWLVSGAKTARPEPQTIDESAFVTPEDRQFWSFQAVRRPNVPAAHSHRVRNPIDAFVLARLQAEQLDLSDDADRRTQARRAYFDLTGLPPTPEELHSFLSDRSPQAYQRLVDKLLASPRYGERWGRHWLDVAGYADSEGYTESDPVREHAFHYRDFVIRALNADMPYSQFVREQLAGDEMVKPPHTNLSADKIRKLTATGFLRMAPDGTGVGGVDQSVARNEVVAGTLEIVSSSLLGLTVGCARCHNHRYDPISQTDYYRLRAVFDPALNWKKWKTPASRRVSLYTDADRKQASRIEARAKVVDAERKKKTEFYIERTLSEELDTLDEKLRQPLRTAYRTPAGKRTAEQKQLLKDHPSVANISAGSLYLYDRRREVRAGALDRQRAEKAKRLVQETREKALAAIAAENRSRVEAAWAAGARRSAGQKKLLQQYPAVSVTEASLAKFNPQAAAELERDKQLAQRLRTEKAADNLKKFAEQAAKIRAEIPPQSFLRVLTEPTVKPPDSFVFIRGDHEQPQKKVGPGELAVIGNRPEIAANDPQLPTSGRRLAYAQHLTSGKHPLLARVIVNRVWAHHMGRGIVESLGDFGRLGTKPTHPQLLDWLASEFVSNGWSLKHLHRLIMTSTTYQQSSRRTTQLDVKDPDNRLYGRMSIRRMEAEVVRDCVLAISGKLNDKMFGQPVPVMEDEVGQIVIGKENLDGERKPTKRIDLNGEEFRRSIYVQARRSRPLAVLETFDTPAMSPNCTKRNSSNAAPQSLLLMNSDFVVFYSREFARRIVSEAGDSDDARIRRAWQLALSRTPSAAQTAASKKFLDEQQRHFAKLPKSSPRFDALASFCQALFSANGFIYID